MKAKLTAALALFLCLTVNGFAHRLNEYLQATMFSVEKDRLHSSMRLVPGVAVSSRVLASIDLNHDGLISPDEQQAYSQSVLRDLSLSLDGHLLTPRLVSLKFPAVEEIKEGLGEINIEFIANLPRGGPNRKLVFENHHQKPISAYLVNCLVPGDHAIQIIDQNRNENQSFYSLNYRQGSGSSPEPLSGGHALFSAFGMMGSLFRLGMRHIAEGTDHLLFLLVLLLPALLIALRSRWGAFAGIRESVTQILRVVTAFTVGHSITLASVAFGVAVAPSRPIEVLIAVSILVSSIHALRPVFPGREAFIAAFFGLIHGLAFAATLGHLGLDRWLRVANIFAFNAGIEAMQLIVVAATMPSLVLLSRTRGYSFVRITGALFAGLAAIGWIAERLLNVHSQVDVVVGRIAHSTVWIALGLFLISLLCWHSRHRSLNQIHLDIRRRLA